MADKLLELYKQLVPDEDPTPFQVFQRGFTAGAVSMRERAMDECQFPADANDIKNSIGQLPDIPQE